MSNQLFAVSDGGGGVGTFSAPGFGAAAAASAGGGAGAGAAWVVVDVSCSGAGLLCLAFVVCGARASTDGAANTIRERARKAPKYQCCEYFIVDSVTAVVAAVDCSVV